MVLSIQCTASHPPLHPGVPLYHSDSSPQLTFPQDEEKIRLKGEVHRLIAPRDQKHQSNFVEFRSSSSLAFYNAPNGTATTTTTTSGGTNTYANVNRDLKIVYRRYAGLFFCVCVDANDNELAYLEAIHFFVEVLDSFFGNVCELDLVFNFYKVC